MARVPITTEFARPTQAMGGERLRFTAARDMVGPAIEGLGRAGQQAANAWNEIEATYDEADALRLDNEMRVRVRERTLTGEDAYLSKRGFDAGENREKVLEDINADAESLLGSARSERARVMAQRAFQARIATTEQQVGIHAIREMESARIAQSNARIEGSITDAIDARGTDQFAVMLGVAQQELITNADRLGWSDEETKDKIDALVSSTYARTALAYDAEDGEPTRALEFVQANRDLIGPEEEARLTAQLAPRVDGAWAQEIVQAGALDSYLTAVPVAEVTDPSGDVSFERIAAITVQSESEGNPNAVSPKGARGIMQVMPATARNPGFGIRPSDGSQADDVRVGREYLGAMQSRYGGDLAKMWAAYNAGPGAVDDAVKAAGDNWLSRMPKETRDYVAKNQQAVGQAGDVPGAPGVAADPRLDSRQMRMAVDKYVAANPGLSERRVQALYQAADQSVNVARADRAQAEQDADRRMLDWIDQNKPGPDDLTSIDQIPAAILAGASPGTRTSLVQRTQAASSRISARADAAEGARAAQIEAEAVFELFTLTDDELARVDMRQYAGRIGIEKLGPWVNRQQAAAEKAQGGAGKFVTGDRIASRIDTLGKDFSASRKMDATPDERQLWADVRGYVEERVAGRPNKDVTDEELRAIILGGLQKAHLEGKGFLGSIFGGGTGRRAQLTNEKIDLSDIPATELARIRASYARAGVPNPSTKDIFDAYQQGRARGVIP